MLHLGERVSQPTREERQRKARELVTTLTALTIAERLCDELSHVPLEVLLQRDRGSLDGMVDAELAGRLGLIPRNTRASR